MVSPFSSPPPQAPLCCLSLNIHLYSPEFYIHDITQCAVFLTDFFQPNYFALYPCCCMYQIKSSFACKNKKFTLLKCWVVVQCMEMPHFVHPLTWMFLLTLGCIQVWLLQIKLLWTFMYMCRHILSLVLDKYLGVKCLGHILGMCFNFLRKCHTTFCTILNSHQ